LSSASSDSEREPPAERLAYEYQLQGDLMGRRVVFLVYGFICYVMFLAAFLYAVGFVGNVVVPKGIDDGEASAPGKSIVINVSLLALFACQHSLMARPAFKRWWRTIVPEPIERSTYVLFTSLILFLIYWQWQPMPDAVWDVGQSALKWPILAVCLLGWLILLAATFMIDHFELFGLKQVWYYLRAKPLPETAFQTNLLYRYTRHPIMLGFVIAFWAAPTMSQGHLLFAVITTVYILIAIQIEEHDLMTMIGDDYRKYRNQVSMLIPVVPNKRRKGPEGN
jgi:protein-S-isoprenylcysteine O-methyltransferase Ste14